MSRHRAALAVALALGCATGGVGGEAERAAGPAPALPVPAAGRPERLVLVSIHGLAPAHYLAPVPAMPVAAALGRAGVAAQAVEPVFPAAPYPAHATLATGLRTVRHRVAAATPFTGDATPELEGTPLWQVAGDRVAALDWPSTGGAAIADLAPDLALPPVSSWSDALAKSGRGRAAELASRAGGADPDAAQPGPTRDAALVTMACALLTAEPAPRLLLLRLSGTARALAATPPDSAAARDAFAAADAELGRLVRCLGDGGRLPTTAIVVAGDHGVVPVHSEVHPNVALAEAGLLTPARGRGIQRWDALAVANGASAFVYAASDDAALLARRALEALANATGTFRVLSAKEMVERGADPEAWFGLEAEPGFVFGEGALGALVGPAPVASAGGLAPRDPRMQTGFLAWGPGLRRGLPVAEMRQVDVAPTLAAWLGLPLPAVEGRPLIGILGGAGGGVR